MRLPPLLPVVVAAVLLVPGGGLDAQRRAPVATGRTALPQPGRMSQSTPWLGMSQERVNGLVTAARLGLDYLPGEVLIKFKRGVSVTGQQRALRALRSRPSVSQLRWSGDIARLSDASQPYATVLASQLAAQPEVDYAQPNYIRRIPASLEPTYYPVVADPAAPSGAPNDPDFSTLQWNFSILDLPSAWDLNPGGSPEVTVAVIDTGLTTAPTTITRTVWTSSGFRSLSLPFAVSPDLSSSRVVSARDFAFEVGPAVLDFDGHGTHVASTIAEDANNAIGLAGIAYKVRLMPLKVCVGYWELMIELGARGIPGNIDASAASCAESDIVDAIRYAADNGAQVINLSLGGSEPAPAERDALLYAVQKGAFVAVAAGNEAERLNEPEYPAAYSTLDGVMAVGAIGKSRTRAYYSNRGSYVEIAAPGGSSRDGGGVDLGFIWQVTLRPSDQTPSLTTPPRFDRYAEVAYAGTSMATPHVAGLAALLMSQGVKDPRAVEAIIKATALDLGTTGRDDEYGYGLIQPRAALFGLGLGR